MQYHCADCDMSVKGLTCGKCGAELRANTITKDDGQKVNVAECPNQCGKIKSPMCCGHDMQATNG